MNPSSPQGDFGVQVWRTGYVGATTVPTWNSQPSWTAEEDEKAFSYGYTDCPAQSVGFSVLESAQWAATASQVQPTVTFGLKGDNETDKYGWKEFLPDATLSVTFDQPPTISNFMTSPSTTCTADNTVGKGDVKLYATVQEPVRH